METSGDKGSIKKVVKSGKGLVVFITTEARKLNIKNGDYVTVCIDNDSGGKRVTIRKLDVE